MLCYVRHSPHSWEHCFLFHPQSTPTGCAFRWKKIVHILPLSTEYRLLHSCHPTSNFHPPFAAAHLHSHRNLTPVHLWRPRHPHSTHIPPRFNNSSTAAFRLGFPTIHQRTDFFCGRILSALTPHSTRARPSTNCCKSFSSRTIDIFFSSMRSFIRVLFTSFLYLPCHHPPVSHTRSTRVGRTRSFLFGRTIH